MPARSTDAARHPLMLVIIATNVWYSVVLADLVLRSVEIGLFDLSEGPSGPGGNLPPYKDNGIHRAGTSRSRHAEVNGVGAPVAK